jgi:hypothetical protein
VVVLVAPPELLVVPPLPPSEVEPVVDVVSVEALAVPSVLLLLLLPSVTVTVFEPPSVLLDSEPVSSLVVPSAAPEPVVGALP